MSQGTLNLDTPLPGWAHRNADANELRAARKQVARKTRRLVLQAIADSEGLTRPEIASLTGLSLQSVCGRVADCLKAGWVEKTKEVRDDCGVVCVSPEGRDVLEGAA